MNRLDALRAEGYDALLARVDQPALSEVVELHGELINIDVKILWADYRSKALRAQASAFGPSIWKIERIEESIVIQPGSATVSG